MSIVIEKYTFRFLKDLARNNNREWFTENKTYYLNAQSNVIQFLDQLIVKMNHHDRLETQSGKGSLYRIYNDMRFSADKTPYNPRFAGHFRRHKPLLRGGYYFWLKPGDSKVGCGFTYPQADDLLRIRQDIDINYKSWRRLLNSKSIQSVFGEMEGDVIKTVPRGFAKDHPALALLRYKQYWFEHRFTDKEVMADHFVDQVNKTFKSIRPLFDYMSEVLTTDLNGEARF